MNYKYDKHAAQSVRSENNFSPSFKYCNTSLISANIDLILGKSCERVKTITIADNYNKNGSLTRMILPCVAGERLLHRLWGNPRRSLYRKELRKSCPQYLKKGKHAYTPSLQGRKFPGPQLSPGSCCGQTVIFNHQNYQSRVLSRHRRVRHIMQKTQKKRLRRGSKMGRKRIQTRTRTNKSKNNQNTSSSYTKAGSPPSFWSSRSRLQ